MVFFVIAGFIFFFRIFHSIFLAFQC